MEIKMAISDQQSLAERRDANRGTPPRLQPL